MFIMCIVLVSLVQNIASCNVLFALMEALIPPGGGEGTLRFSHIRLDYFGGSKS